MNLVILFNRLTGGLNEKTRGLVAVLISSACAGLVAVAFLL